MQKSTLFVLLILYSLKNFALTPYHAIYDMYADTTFGNFKLGTVEFNLETTNNDYIYSSVATTDSIWDSLYKYSRYEKSTGSNIYNELVSNSYSVVEKRGDHSEKNIKIDFFPDKNYATYNNKKKWKIAPGVLVDELSVYLALSEDIKKNPNQIEFTYQVALEDKVKVQKFFISETKNITLLNKSIEIIIVKCPELNLVLQLSKEHNFIPVIIDKVNKKNSFHIILNSFKT